MKFCLLLPVCLFSLEADTLSYTGSLATSSSVFEQSFSLTSTSTVEIATWGFGGGTNGAGTVIPAGGFDPLVALFSGAGVIVTDSLGDPVAGADTLTNFVGNCPPAGTVVIGTGSGSTVCGDVFLEADNLPAGNYLLVLSDANYFPIAVNPGPPGSSLLSDGFTDLTSGVFQTCNTTSDGLACVTPTGNFAVDVTGQGIESPVPEPASWMLLTIAVAVIAAKKYRNQFKNNGGFNGF